AVLSSTVVCLRLASKETSPAALREFLSSAAGEAALEQASTGTVIPHLSLSALRQLTVPVLEPELLTNLEETRRLEVQKAIIERTTRILVETKSTQYFSYVAEKGGFSFWLRRDVYRKQRRHDGLFVLRSNHPDLSSQEILDAYLQLQEIERCFRVIKSVLKLRPIYHHQPNRVESHVFLPYLPFLLAKVMEQKLKAAGLEVSVSWALDQLSRLQAVEHTWEKEALVVQHTAIDIQAQSILDALGIRMTNRVVRVARPAAA